MNVTIGTIVEGHGEVAAVPELLRRIGRELFSQEVHCLRPHRLPRSSMVKSAELERALTLQVSRVGRRGGVIVLLDADDDDAQSLADSLQEVAHTISHEVRVVVAVREFEAWFLAGMESLRSHKSVREDAAYDGDPEAKRDAKGAVQSQMTERYAPIRHQVAFCTRLDLELTRERSPSFGRMVQAVEDLVRRSGSA